MEVIPFFLSIIIVVLALYWSVREYRRKPGTPTYGLFRYHEVLDSSVARAKDLNAKNLLSHPGRRSNAALAPAVPKPLPYRPLGR
jgi:hypothetical protein